MHCKKLHSTCVSHPAHRIHETHLHLGRLTWNLKTWTRLEDYFPLQPDVFFRLHVNFAECTCLQVLKYIEMPNQMDAKWTFCFPRLGSRMPEYFDDLTCRGKSRHSVQQGSKRPKSNPNGQIDMTQILQKIIDTSYHESYQVERYIFFPTYRNFHVPFHQCKDVLRLLVRQGHRQADQPKAHRHWLSQ